MAKFFNTYGGKEFNGNDLNSIESIIKDGYIFYVTHDTQTSGTDPWSGMPNNHVEYWAFKNREDAEKCANNAVGNIFNPDIESSVSRLEDLLNDRQQYAKNIEDRRAKDAAAASKRKDYQNNLPQWRKKRSSLMRINTQMDNLKRQIQELQPEYDRLAGELKAALDQDGVKYDSIEQVLSKDFLK